MVALERMLQQMKEEEEKTKAEVRDLRDRLEEEVWAKNRLEEKIAELTDKLKEVEEETGQGGGGGAMTESDRDSLLREERRKDIKEAEDRMAERVKQAVERGGGAGGGGGGEGEEVEE